MIIEKDGLGGLFGRGLRTKILANAVQVGGGGRGGTVVRSWHECRARRPGSACALSALPLQLLPP